MYYTLYSNYLEQSQSLEQYWDSRSPYGEYRTADGAPLSLGVTDPVLAVGNRHLLLREGL